MRGTEEERMQSDYELTSIIVVQSGSRSRCHHDLAEAQKSTPAEI